MKNLIVLAGFMTLVSCSQIEKATEKWKTPESAQTGSASTATQKTEVKSEAVTTTKKKTKKGTKQAKATTTTTPKTK